MIHSKLVHSKLLSLQVEKHPMFGTDKKYQWPYQGFYEGSTAEDIILLNAWQFNSCKDIEFIKVFIDDNFVAADCTISSVGLEENGLGLADALFFEQELKVKEWSYDIMICSIFLYALKCNLKKYRHLKRYDKSATLFSDKAVTSICMPIPYRELLLLFISAQIGPRLGPLLNTLYLFNEPESIIYALDSLTSWSPVLSSYSNSNCREEGLVNFLTLLQVNVTTARKIAKRTIETDSLVYLLTFLDKYKLEKQAELTIKK